MTDAKEYGKALFLITEEDGTTERVYAEIKSASSVVKKNPEYEKIIDTPALAKEERVGLIDEAFSQYSENLVNLMKILAERRSFHLFTKVADAYLAFYNEARGIEDVEAVTSIPLSPEQTAALAKKLGTLTGKTIVVHNTVDASILGGMKLRYSGIQLDGSVKTRLDKFEAALKDTVL